jgi:mono/diheme cytochrome c family protein
MIRRLLVLALVAPALLAVGCGGEEAGEPDATQETATATATATDSADEGQASTGRETFVSTCGGCHTLSDAGTNGRVGPNLDDLSPAEEDVLGAIASGPGQMPANLLEGEEAQLVAEYVATSAGG